MTKKEELEKFLEKDGEGEVEEETGKIPTEDQKKDEDSLIFKKPALGLESVHIGSLALLTIFLIISLWMLVPTSSGKTRAELLWLTLFGETRLVTDTGFDGSTTVPGGGPSLGGVTTVESTVLPLDFSAMEMGF